VVTFSNRAHKPLPCHDCKAIRIGRELKTVVHGFIACLTEERPHQAENSVGVGNTRIIGLSDGLRLKVLRHCPDRADHDLVNSTLRVPRILQLPPDSAMRLAELVGPFARTRKQHGGLGHCTGTLCDQLIQG